MTVSTFDTPRSNFELLVAQARQGSPVLWSSAIVMGLIGLVCLGLQLVDARIVGEVNTWVKPAKFSFSIGLQFATLAWAAALLPAAERLTRRTQTWLGVLLACGWAELAYIIFRAARAEASHFNDSTVFAQVAYSLMGVGAIMMVATTVQIGTQLWKHRRDGLMTEAASLGMVLGGLLGGLAGIAISVHGSHSVGGLAGPGLGVFGWSTTGGDLRIAHFLGLHAMQIIPFAALSGKRPAVYAAAIAITLGSIAVFLQAAAGVPLLRG